VGLNFEPSKTLLIASNRVLSAQVSPEDMGQKEERRGIWAGFAATHER
jgi:hypothetical protein